MDKRGHGSNSQENVEGKELPAAVIIIGFHYPFVIGLVVYECLLREKGEADRT